MRPLRGLEGNDTVSGGLGEDTLAGGPGRDSLSGGGHADTFVFTLGTSGITVTRADTITDWNSNDVIDLALRGTSTNYAERATSAGTIQAAAAFAENTFTDPKIAYVFLYNKARDVGYLLSDLNNDDRFENGVVLRSAGLAGDFGFLDIV